MATNRGQSPADWFIEINGNRIGPYSGEQIRGLLEDGELLPDHRVTSTAIGEKWITAKEMVNLESAAKLAQETAAKLAREAAANSAPQPQAQPRPQAASPIQPSPQMPEFRPPPRPPALDSPETVDPEAAIRESAAADVTLSLFETIQSAKERQSTLRSIPAPKAPKGEIALLGQFKEASDEALENWKKLDPRARYAVGAAALLLVVGGLLLMRHGDGGASIAVKTEVVAPPPVVKPVPVAEKNRPAPAAIAPPTAIVPQPPKVAQPMRAEKPAAPEYNDDHRIDDRVAGDVAGDMVDRDPVPSQRKPGRPKFSPPGLGGPQIGAPIEMDESQSFSVPEDVQPDDAPPPPDMPAS